MFVKRVNDMKVMLTSCGLETEEIKSCFMDLFDSDPKDIRALFIPTAAIDPGAVSVLPKCMNDLLKCEIPDGNVIVFDLHRNMEYDELKGYDVVYLCGGSPSYLLERVNDSGFSEALARFVKEDGIVLGVSAGSMIFSADLENNLGLVNTELYVHCASGEKAGRIEYPFTKNIALSNTQALIIRSPDDVLIIGE